MDPFTLERDARQPGTSCSVRGGLRRRQLGRVRLDPLRGQLDTGAPLRSRRVDSAALPPVQLRVELPFLDRLNAQLLAARAQLRARSSLVGIAQSIRWPGHRDAQAAAAAPLEPKEPTEPHPCL